MITTDRHTLTYILHYKIQLLWLQLQLTAEYTFCYTNILM